jgi:hypothetical protein
MIPKGADSQDAVPELLHMPVITVGSMPLRGAAASNRPQRALESRSFPSSPAVWDGRKHPRSRKPMMWSPRTTQASRLRAYIPPDPRDGAHRDETQHRKKAGTADENNRWTTWRTCGTTNICETAINGSEAPACLDGTRRSAGDARIDEMEQP